MDGRQTAKRDEDIRVQWICEENLNDYSELGTRMKKEYYDKFNNQKNRNFYE